MTAVASPLRHPAAPRSPDRRVTVLFEPGRSGLATLRHGAEIAGQPGSALTVVVIAARAPESRGCLPSPRDYNWALRQDALARSREASRLLREHGARATEVVLVDRRGPTLRNWVLKNDVQLLLLPARLRPWGWGGHPALRSLRGVRGVEVRVVPGS